MAAIKQQETSKHMFIYKQSYHYIVFVCPQHTSEVCNWKISPSTHGLVLKKQI